ncbi:MAG: apolipoprotein N-acyltransferase [Leptothrix sp. (in: Bacteria)]|nr:apolipoprotein N-acyltransferase [Leptothrix sp. (in: b-proteobacteria)]
MVPRRAGAAARRRVGRRRRRLSPGQRARVRVAAPVEAAAMAALGALQSLAFVHTTLWLLCLMTLAALVWRLDAASPRRAALLGWAYGTGWLCAGTWWLFISMYRYGGLPAPLAAAAVFALAAALSLYLAAACAAYARWRRGNGFDALLFAALWLLAELARGLLFTGFPWVASGYALVDSPLAALAPWVGVYGMGALMAALAAACAVLAAQRQQVPAGAPRPRMRGLVLAVPLAPVVLAAALPHEFTRPEGELGVALLQTNVSQDEKFSAERLPATLAWVGRELLAARAELVVAPETAVPLLPEQLEDMAPGYWAMLQGAFATPGRAALVGVPLGDFERGYTNSVVGLGAGPPYRYDKTHLVPFGEFIPLGFRWFTQMMNIPLGDFARGVANPPSFAVGVQRVAPNICYEDLFGEELARRFVDPALAPTVFANVSNLAWFGNTVALPQHLNISRLRTLEFQRPMLRATNTGATAAIDHRGNVLAQLPPYTAGVLSARVEGRSGTTPFAWWAGRWGVWPLALAAWAVLAAAAGLRRRAA